MAKDEKKKTPAPGKKALKKPAPAPKAPAPAEISPKKAVKPGKASPRAQKPPEPPAAPPEKKASAKKSASAPRPAKAAVSKVAVDVDPALLAARLLDAHLEHEIGEFSGKRFEALVEREVAAVFEWMGGVTLNQIVPPEITLAVIRRNVLERPPAGGLAEIIGEMAREFLILPENDGASLEDIFPRRYYDDMVDKALSLDRLRRRIIHRMVHNSGFPRLITDIMYSLLRDLAWKENPLVRKIPGLNLLVALSRGAVDRTLPDLPLAAETRVREFVESNLEYAMREGENFLLRFFDAERLAEIADQRWDEVAHQPLSAHLSAMDGLDLEEFIVIGYEFWLNFRQTPYFVGVMDAMVRFFHDRYGTRDLDLLAEDIGITPEIAIREIKAVAGPILANPEVAAILRSRLAEHLAGFYTPERIREILET